MKILRRLAFAAIVLAGGTALYQLRCLGDAVASSQAK